jgi:hypothetical protein
MLAILNAAYPTTFKNMSEATRKAQIEIWHFALSDEPAEIVITALKEYILSNQFPPTIAGLRQYMQLLDNSDAELLSEAWSAVCGNIRFEDLSAENKLFFGSQARVDQYGYDSDTVQTVFAGQHRKALGEIRKRVRAKKAVEQLPNLHVLEGGG